jgi:hypothetical protein
MSTIKVDKITGRTGSAGTAPITLSGDTVTLGSNVISETATTSTLDPTIATNPSAVGHLWINSTSGDAYICTDATAGANVWTSIGDKGQGIPNYNVDFLVIAGGGAGSAGKPSGGGGGGGAGGYRTSYGSGNISGGLSAVESALSFASGTVYIITVGAGGSIDSSTGHGSQGSPSSISGSNITDITTVGGGHGGWANSASYPSTTHQSSGGSGGSSDQRSPGGSGIANQGFDGAAGGGNGAGGGGGAGGLGSAIPSSAVGGAGGPGISSSITGSAVTRGGGGGGSSNTTGGAGGGGGGGAAATNSSSDNATAGSANYGGGGGGAYANYFGALGGSGVVILRMPTASYSGTSSGSPTVTTNGSDTIIVFNDNGSYTA